MPYFAPLAWFIWVGQSMCLTIFCSEYLPIDFLGEYIHIRFEKGQIQTEEVYDVFFQAPDQCESLCFYFLSPHNLLTNRKVSVELSKTPHAKQTDEVVHMAPFYPLGPRQSCGFDAADGGQFWIELPVATKGGVETKKFSGQVLCREPVLPPDILQVHTEKTIELMSAFGTLFCISFPNLTGGRKYAMRIKVNPVRLLHLPEPLSVDTAIPDQPQTQWKQFATVMDPSQCRFNFELLLDSIEGEPRFAEFRQCRPIIDLILNNAAKYTLPVEYHRIAVICPPNCDLDVEASAGDCIAQGPTVIAKGKRSFMLAQWNSGRAAYPHSHPETSSRAILQWLVEWAGGPKTKEDITTAVLGNHQNVSILVDELQRVGLVISDPKKPGLYAPDVAKTTKEREDGILQIAKDRDVAAKLIQKGYQVQYDLTYYYLRPADEEQIREKNRLLAEERERNRTAYLLAWAGIGLALLGIIFSLLPLLL